MTDVLDTSRIRLSGSATTRDDAEEPERTFDLLLASEVEIGRHIEVGQ